ncbi:trigger factor [Slackia heliotrinireducens]|nr:trigger factor [Slackia heliotrinireducens]
MAYHESVWRRFVEDYDIDVPEEAIENELRYVELQLRHNMQYDRLAGGDMHMFPTRELDEQREEMRAAAVFEAKEPRVIKAIVAERGIDVTYEELEAEAEAIAKRQNSTIEEVKRFFGEDLGMLRRDVLDQKAREWACNQISK